jgi:hypothetical protein
MSLLQNFVAKWADLIGQLSLEWIGVVLSKMALLETWSLLSLANTCTKFALLPSESFVLIIRSSKVKWWKLTARNIQINIPSIISLYFRFGNNVFTKFRTMVDNHYVVTIFCDSKPTGARVTTNYFSSFRYILPIERVQVISPSINYGISALLYWIYKRIEDNSVGQSYLTIMIYVLRKSWID